MQWDYCSLLYYWQPEDLRKISRNRMNYLKCFPGSYLLLLPFSLDGGWFVVGFAPVPCLFFLGNNRVIRFHSIRTSGSGGVEASEVGGFIRITLRGQRRGG